jgi:hypothetical protein
MATGIEYVDTGLLVIQHWYDVMIGTENERLYEFRKESMSELL